MQYCARARAIDGGELMFGAWIFLCGFAVMIINWDAAVGDMQSLLQHYNDFKKIIIAGFDPSVATFKVPTWPMWGYGWVLTLTSSKITILSFQVLGMSSSALYFFYMSRTRNLLNIRECRMAMFVLAVSAPWYAVHTIMWPYSPAGILLVLGVILLAGNASMKNRYSYALSGACFGLMMNFRSDYILLPLALGLVLIIFREIKIYSKILIFLAVYFIFLIPWAVWTKHSSHKMYFGSSNSGHVMFIGLGQLPNNTWGIQPSDGDPLMMKLCRENVTRERAPWTSNELSCSAEADGFLKHEFWKRVCQKPDEWISKLQYVTLQMLLEGADMGSFKTSAFRIGVTGFDLTELFRDIANLSMRITGRGVVILSFLSLPFTLIQALKKKNILLIFVTVIILYQAALNIFLYQFPHYTANAFFFHVVNFSVAVVMFAKYLHQKNHDIFRASYVSHR